jgi:mono/diheme cytochrome c family protein
MSAVPPHRPVKSKTSFLLLRRVRLTGLALLAGAVWSPMQAALPPEKIALLPAASKAKVDFARDIQPIFEASCVQCHGRGKNKGIFSVETREDFVEGGETGVPAVAGKSAESLVVAMISGLDADIVMPKKGKVLTKDQVAVFRAWIDQGMPWPKEINFKKHEPANLRARELAELALPPAVASAAGATTAKVGENPVDRFVNGVFAKNRIAWPSVVDDRAFARRVWLDVVGLLPPPAELDAFLADRAPDKRAQLVQRLLGDHQRYAEHWLTFWNDLLRNDYKGTGYIDGGRKPITTWLYTALARNLPYDRFVAQLVDPGTEAEGFAKGITWRGTVNASMVPPMQAAQSVAQVFLGVNLKCASCHDSFIDEYTLKDAYGLAAIYADGPIEIAECDKPTGQMGRVKFLYEEIGLIDAKADSAARKRQLAEIITGRKNGRLPRTIVNRVWQRFMGYGLVEPVDEMDKPAWSPELMDLLAEDFVAHGYDMKHLMARILTSRAYQLPAVNVGEKEERFVFRGPGVRRLGAEQFSDALMALAGMSYPKADAKLNRALALQRATLAPLPLTPKWIWATPDAHLRAKPASVVFKRVVTLAAAPTEAWLTIAADNTYAVAINGKNAASASKRSSTGADIYDVKGQLKKGENTITVTSLNFLPDGTSPIPREAEAGKNQEPLPLVADNPAGLILYARVRAAETVMDFVSDGSWSASVAKAAPQPAVELGGVDLAPWRLGGYFLELAASDPEALPVQRAALVAANPLMAALGRPNREQVMTVRQGAATTLQALELTNGSTLAVLLTQAAEKILADTPADMPTPKRVSALYRHALSRAPTAAELSAAVQLVGTPATSAGLQDLLWALAMLPEFQLIY